nr:zinc knuckle CX2CX4HX4C [Tanacetum cinerariifolium]
MIRKSPIILSKWSPNVSLKRGKVTKVPVWVKMYNVPVLAYSKDGLSLLGTLIGKPIMLDAFTSSMLNKPKSKVMWQQKKGVDAISNSTSPGVSSNAVGDDKSMSNPGLNTSNSFDVLNADGDDMGDSGTQPKVSEFVSSDLNKNRKEACKPSSSKSVYGDGHKDKNVSSPPELNKWDVINEDDTAHDEDVFTSYGASVGGGNQLEDEDCDFFEGYADHVVDLDGALKEFRDFKLSMSTRETKTTVMEENNDGFTEVKSHRKNKGANFKGIRLNKPKSKVMWQQKKGVDAISNSTSPGVSSNAVGDDKGMSNPSLNTSNSFDVSEFVSSDLNKNRKEACKPSSSKPVNGDGHKDKNVSSPPELNKWDVINEDDTANDEDVFTSYGASVGGGNQLEDEDYDFYEGYVDQVVDLDGALKEFRYFKLSMSSRK